MDFSIVSVSADDQAGLRRRQPYNQPLPATMRWMAMLPAEVRPSALLRQFPRIANLIARNWASPSDCLSYIAELLTDRRGHRRGFPADVLEDILTLDEYLRGRYPQLPVAGH